MLFLRERQADFVRQARKRELEIVARWIPNSARILELGAGSGWQARLLSQEGHTVTALDVQVLEARNSNFFEVEEFDGVHMPFPDNHFDVVFSSNVLEHAEHLDELLNESKRVLKSDGMAIHVLPTATWRIWTTVTYYPCGSIYSLDRLLEKMKGRQKRSEDADAKSMAATRSRLKFLVPPVHGARGNFLTEIFRFSRFFWTRLFCSNGWRIQARCVNGLFYTGHSLLGVGLPWSVRKALSRFAGSACVIYVLTKANRPASVSGGSIGIDP